MIQVHFYCSDYAGEEAKQLRKEHLRAHLDYIEANMQMVSVAGPLFDEQNETIIGSCVVYKVETVAEAQLLFEQDPYYQAERIWEQIETRVFRTVAGEWIGGKRW